MQGTFVTIHKVRYILWQMSENFAKDKTNSDKSTIRIIKENK